MKINGNPEDILKAQNRQTLHLTHQQLTQETDNDYQDAMYLN